MTLFFNAVFLLAGAIIGAGVFALPYVFSRSGFLPSLVGVLFLGALMTVLNLFYCQIILKTKGDHQLPGYVKKYLGEKTAKLAVLAMLISINGALLAYVILGGDFLALSFGQLAASFYNLCFYVLGIWFFWRGFKFLTKIEFWLTVGLIVLMIAIPISLTGFIHAENYVLITSKPLFFWGTALFALTGFSVIPEVEEILCKKRHLLIPTVIVGSLIPIILYFAFGFSVWGVSGAMTTADALSGLVTFFPSLIRFGAVVGLLALMTSFLALTNVAKEVYFRDLKFKEKKAKFLAVLPSFFGVFLSIEGFIKIISFTGAVGLVISGSLICLMFAKLQPRFKWLAWLVSLFFILGAIASSQ